MKILFVIVIILFIVIACVMAIALIKPELLIKDKDVTAGGSQGSYDPSGQEIGDTKDFIPLESFEDYAMCLGNYSYRAIIECSSLNYSLMNAIEQDMVEKSYIRFLNTLHFPVTTYVQTREFDNNLMLSNLHAKIAVASKKFPQVKKYGNTYEEEMKYLTQYIGNSKTKHKYIIVPFESSDLSNVSELNDYEIKEFIIEELLNRCSIVMSGIEGVGVKAKLLNKSEIAECLYSYYHRDYYRIAKDIVFGGYDSLAINSDFTKLTERQKLDCILLETQNKIKAEMHRQSSSVEEIAFYRYIVDVLDTFKQDDKPESISQLLHNTEYTAVANGYAYEYEQYYNAHPELYNEDFKNDSQQIEYPQYVSDYFEQNPSYVTAHEGNSSTQKYDFGE